jgi:hypothetical protein
MNVETCTRETLRHIEDLLHGSGKQKDAWKWALEVIKSDIFENLPSVTQEAIHALFLLHDSGKPWVPTQEEFAKYETALKDIIRM